MNDIPVPRRLDATEALESFVQAHPIAAVYFSGPDCGVCHALRPRLEAMLAERFPELTLAEVDCGRLPETAAQNGVFSIPTLVVWLEGREFLRRARNISPGEVADALARPYAMFTSR